MTTTMVGNLRPIRDTTTASELLDDWALWMRSAGLADRTVRERCQIVGRVAQGATVSPEVVTSRQIQVYLARTSIGQATRATYHVALSAWFRWLVAQGHREDDPMGRVPRPRVPRRRPRPVESAHLERVLDSRMHRRTRTMILLAAYQGLRVHEIAKVRGEDIDLVGARLYVVGKGGVDDWLPLHPRIAEEAVGYPRRGWWFPTHIGNRGQTGHVLGRSVSTIISNAIHRAGVQGSAHPLRHWYGTELVRSGADLRTTQTLLRHASLATTQIYTLIGEDRRAEAIGRLPEFDR